MEVFQEYFQINGDTLVSDGHYYSLNTKACTEETSYEGGKRLNSSDILFDIVVNLDRPEWRDYSNVETKKFDYLFIKGKNLDLEKLSNQKKSLKSRLRIGYRLPFWITSTSKSTVDFQHPIAAFRDSTTSKRELDFALETFLTYEISDSFLIEFGGFDSFQRRKFSGAHLNILYEKKINQSNAPTFINIGMRWSFMKQRQFFQSNTSSEVFSIEGKEFDSGEYDTYFEQRAFTLFPMVSFSKKFTNTSRLHIGCIYPINVASREGVFFQEIDSFLKQKKVFSSQNVAIEKKTVMAT